MAKTLLGEAFGTKKSQKALRSLTENAITSPSKPSKDPSGKMVLDAAASAVIDTMEETSSFPSRKDLQNIVDDAKPRPKANQDAQTPAEVYTIQSLVGADILGLLNIVPWQNAVRGNKPISTISRFTSRRITQTINTKDVTKIKALKLYLTLLEWRKSFKSVGKDRFRVPDKADIKRLTKDTDPMILDQLKRRFAPDSYVNFYSFVIL
jgi:DNA-directed RNA polymerase I subunit RPA49